MRYRDEPEHIRVDNVFNEIVNYVFFLYHNDQDENSNEFEIGFPGDEDNIILTKDELIQLGEEIIQFAHKTPEEAYAELKALEDWYADNDPETLEKAKKLVNGDAFYDPIRNKVVEDKWMDN